MRVLLDTQALLWWLFDLPQLGPKAREVISGSENTIYVSAVSAVEIGTKQAIGKLEAPDELEAQIAANWFVELPVSVRHALTVGDLPLYHRDPFDRLLVAQAQCEGLTLISSDRRLNAYGVSILPA
jgi:PIN domain nuclease of toxin-antitoxin system